MFSDALAKQKHGNINLLKVGRNRILCLEKLKSWGGGGSGMSFQMTLRESYRLGKAGPRGWDCAAPSRRSGSCLWGVPSGRVAGTFARTRMRNEHGANTNKARFQVCCGRRAQASQQKQSSERVDGDRGDTPRGTFSGDGTERACGLLPPNAGAGGRARFCSRVKGLFEKSLCKCVSKLSHSSASRPSAPGVGATWRPWRLRFTSISRCRGSAKGAACSTRSRHTRGRHVR